jgi:hypothetical protein
MSNSMARRTKERHKNYLALYIYKIAQTAYLYSHLIATHL